jgi:hypothetical protein
MSTSNEGQADVRRSHSEGNPKQKESGPRGGEIIIKV